MSMKKKLLWVGDAGCPSGFARATHGILETVKDHYDVVVLAINYQGDPNPYPYDLYAAAVGGDALGVGRLVWMCKQHRPDVIVVQQDGWFIPYYIAAMRKRAANGEYVYPEVAAIPVVAAVALDGKNFRGEWLKDVTMAVFWTHFAMREARIGGYAGVAKVIPLGVDLETFYPVDRLEAMQRQRCEVLKDMFIVGNVNRNQFRKRWDLTVQYFADWVNSRKIKDAELFLHVAPTGDDAVNIMQLAKYYGILDRLAMREPEIFYGNPDDDMRDTYNFMDVCISTTQGEGMGLTTLEAMACGTPCIVPDWSALGDWARGAASLVPCTSTAMNATSSINGTAVIGGIADEGMFLQALDLAYNDAGHRKLLSERALMRAREPQFRWESIGQAWVEALGELFAPQEEDTPVWREIKTGAPA